MKNPGNRVKYFVGLTMALLSLIVWTAQAQTSNKAMLEELIRGLGVSVEDLNLPAQAKPAQDIRVRWQGETTDSPTGVPAERQSQPRGAFAVSSRRTALGSLPRQRAPELSSSQVLVLAVDAQKQLKGWALIPDPRVLRAEFPGQGGELSGQVIYQSKAEFIVALPDDPEIAELRFYHPRWTGKAFDLELIEAIQLQ
jgi:hypothetical protein